MKDGNYECLCPLGKTGKFCETSVFISDPLFNGGNSFMSLTLDSAIRFNTEINLEIRPDSLDGLIVHFGQSRDARHQDYFTIMLKNSTLVSKVLSLLEACFDLISGSSLSIKFKSWAGKLPKIWGSNPRSGRSSSFFFTFSNSSYKSGYLLF